MFTLAWLLLAFNYTEIDADNLGYYAFEGVQVVEIDDSFLFSNYSENTLHLIDASGRVLHSYRSSGQGPDALMAHSVIGFDYRHIYIHSHRNRVVVFSRELKFEKSYVFDGMPSGVSAELLYMESPKTAVISLPQEDWQRKAHVARISLNPDKLILSSKHLFLDDDSEYFQMRPSPFLIRAISGHAGLIFLTQPQVVEPGAKEYRVIVMSGLPNKLEMAYQKLLFGPLTDMTIEKGRWITVGRPVVYSGNYVIMLTNGNRNGQHLYFWDIFDKNGGFKRRIPQSHYRILLPVSNSSKVFLVEEIGEKITLKIFKEEM